MTIKKYILNYALREIVKIMVEAEKSVALIYLGNRILMTLQE